MAFFYGTIIKTILKYMPNSNKISDEEREVLICKFFLLDISEKESFQKSNSYEMKHIIEKYSGEYISETSFIKALKDLKFETSWATHTKKSVYSKFSSFDLHIACLNKQTNYIQKEKFSTYYEIEKILTLSKIKTNSTKLYEVHHELISNNININKNELYFLLKINKLIRIPNKNELVQSNFLEQLKTNISLKKVGINIKKMNEERPF